MSRKDRKFKGFFRQKLGDLQKKKKRSSPKFRAIFLPKFRNFKRLRGGYFPFFTENRPQKHKKHAILHTSQANGGARAPPPPPWLRYWLSHSIIYHIRKGVTSLMFFFFMHGSNTSFTAFNFSHIFDR